MQKLIYSVNRLAGGLNLWIIIFILLLAVAAYFLKEKGIIP